MHLKIQKRGGRDYLSIVQNYRQNGTTRTRTIETIGYADAYAERYDDPIAHFRAYVKQLNEQAAARNHPIDLSFAPDETIDFAAAPPARLGAAIALGCLDVVGVASFFRARANHPEALPHAGRVFEMLAAERMMHAASKRESWTARASFPRPCDFSYEDVYRALPFIAHEEQRLSAHLLRTWENAHGPHRTDCIYIACGRYAFPWNGEQRMGNARSSALVAMDGDGMPLDYHIVDGKLDGKTLVDAVELLKARLDARRAVAIVGTLHQFDTYLEALSAAGLGFVLYQADVDSTEGLSDWVNDANGYLHAAGNVKMKTRIAQRDVRGCGRVPVREVVLDGGGYALHRGRAVIVSSETALSADTVTQLFRELWRQAEPFQPLEADFSPMPAPVELVDHAHAHFAICYAAFFALRVLRRSVGWRHNAADTADALLRMEGVHLQRNYYLFNYRSTVTDDIERAMGIPPARRLRTRAELRSVPAQVKHALG